MIQLNYFDSHCHPHLSAFDADRAGVLSRMQDESVGGLVVGIDAKTSAEAVELAEAHDFLWAAVGLHPNDQLGERFDIATYRKLAQHPKVAAIGECGLDYYRNEPTAEEKKRQHERFRQHIVLALEVKKPLMVHCRPTRNSMNAHREMLDILKQHTDVRAIIHFFTGNAEIAEEYIAAGHFLSFPGVITFTNEYDDVVRRTPLDRILSETDSPFAAPVPHRGKRNEPAYVIEVVKKIAELKNRSLEEVRVQILQNTGKAFNFE